MDKHNSCRHWLTARLDVDKPIGGARAEPYAIADAWLGHTLRLFGFGNESAFGSAAQKVRLATPRNSATGITAAMATIINTSPITNPYALRHAPEHIQATHPMD